MFFNSIQYLVFLPLVLLAFYATKAKYRWIILFIASGVFYMYFIPKYILCLFFLIITDYLLAKKIYATESVKIKKRLLLLSIISNFGLLFFFKYLNFFIENINYCFSSEISLSDTILPIGLSFHTFQSVSYVIDVYKNKIKPENHLGIYSTYVLFFPQMVAGPIERFNTLGEELKKKNTFNYSFLSKGLPLILIGLFYKMVIADNCGDYVNDIYSSVSKQNNYNVLIAIFLFSIQIYSDFFGYSLIAQGSAKLFGINLIDNFNFPFFSENIIVFWRKWHMSLTNWFRDYVYFALGGNRKSKLKHYINIIIVFTLSGFWHGAGFNFIIWGFLHSIFYLLLFVFLPYAKIKMPKPIGYVVTFCNRLLFFLFFFRSGKLSESITILKSTVALNEGSEFRNVSLVIILNVAVIFLTEYFAKKHNNYSSFIEKQYPIAKIIWFCYLIFALLTFSGIDNLPFIYFPILMKRLIYIPVLIIVFWLANEVYVRSGLYLKDIHKCSAELVLTMDSSIHKKNIIYFGESSNFTFAENDSCKKSISELLGDLNTNNKILTLSKGAIHAATYEQLVKRVKDNSDIKAVIISLNLRSFGINWIQSNLESNLSRANVLYSNYPPVIKKMMLSLKIYDNKDEFKRKEIIKWHYKYDKFTLKSKKYTNVRDWDAVVFDKGVPNENGIKDQFKTDVACHFIKNYAFVLNESNPRIMNLDNIITFCKEKKIKLIFNLLPENYQKAENLCGEDLKLLMQENVNFLKSRYQNKTTFIDNFSLLADSCFIDKNWPTEHYIYFGRKLLAERLNEKLNN